jgi:hypothetical protein
MKTPFESTASSGFLVRVLFGLALADPIFLLAFPTGPGVLYWSFFAMYAALGLSLGFVHKRKWVGFILVVYLGLIVTAYSLKSISGWPQNFAYAYPGFFNGAGVVVAAVLFKRYALRKSSLPYKSTRLHWENREARYNIIAYALMYVAVFLIDLQLFLVRSYSYAPGWVAFIMIITGTGYKILSNHERLRTKREKKLVEAVRKQA